MSFAFVFPGQGSQSLKMMDGLIHLPEISQIFNQSREVLGIDFLAMLQEETPENINQTVNTQPLMLTADIAIYTLWSKLSNKKPSIMVGHSLGEWSALVASGVLSFTDALKLVKLRAEAMQEAVPEGVGAMAAILGLDDASVIKVCREVETQTLGVVAGVNFNSPGQVVIAGDKNSVEKAVEVLKENGAIKVQLLAVSVPSHCSLMKPAGEQLAEAIAEVEFKTPQIPVLQNFDANSYSDVNLIKDALVKQLYSPVLWTSTITKMADMGITQVLECGPGKVLTSLNKRISDKISSYTLNNQADLDKALAELQ